MGGEGRGEVGKNKHTQGHVMLKWFCIILIALIVILIMFIAYTQSRQTTYYQGPITDHFNGKHFVNAPPYQLKTFKDTLKWMFNRHRAQWPAHVQNTHQPSLNAPQQGEIKLTYVNHATVLIQTPQLTVLTDPIWSKRTSPYSWIGPKRVRPPGVAFDQLPPIDVVVISHNHYDHLDLKTLQRLNQKFAPMFIVPLGVDTLLREYGIQHVVALDWWQAATIKQAVITFMPTQHWSARGISDRFATLWGSYGIAVGGQKIYFGGDAGYSPYFKLIKTKWGAPDVALLPIGAYAPRWFMQQNHMNPEEAVQAYQDLSAKFALGIHFGTFQLTDEAIDQPLKDLAAALEKLKVDKHQFITLDNGETKTLQ